MSIESLTFDDTSILNSKMMEVSMEVQKVIANNLANAETPGYTRLKLDFQNSLSKAVKSGSISEVENLDPELVEDTTNAPGLDGNNISVTLEMNEMMQNSVFYNLLNRAFKTRMGILKSAIRG